MKKLLFVLLTIISVSTYAQIAKTGGILYSNGNPNTKGLDTLTLKNLNRNSEVAVDISDGSLHVFNRADSVYVPVKTTLFETLTLPQFQSSVVYKTLVPGTVYKITGVHKNKSNGYIDVLYDDGTNSGITIYLTALSNSTFTNSGYGEFYNPKYQSYLNYTNEDKTGLWGIWDTTYTTYLEGDRAIWGGYMWENNGDGNGAPDGEYSLTDWTKLPYSDTSAYKKVIDYIEYDFDNDFITRRRDEVANIDVDFKIRNFNIDSWYPDDNPISAMQWGNYNLGVDIDYIGKLGTQDVSVSNMSLYRCINFKCETNAKISLCNSAKIYNLYCFYSTISNLTLNGGNIYDGKLNLSNLSGVFYQGFIYNFEFLSVNFDGQIVGSSLFNLNLTNSFVSGLIMFNSQFKNLTATLCGFYNCWLYSDTRLNFSNSGTLNDKNMIDNHFYGTHINDNLSSATKIFGDYHKNIFKRADGTIRLSYYNNSDTLQVVNVTD